MLIARLMVWVRDEICHDAMNGNDDGDGHGDDVDVDNDNNGDNDDNNNCEDSKKESIDIKVDAVEKVETEDSHIECSKESDKNGSDNDDPSCKENIIDSVGDENNENIDDDSDYDDDANNNSDNLTTFENPIFASGDNDDCDVNDDIKTDDEDTDDESSLDELEICGGPPLTTTHKRLDIVEKQQDNVYRMTDVTKKKKGVILDTKDDQSNDSSTQSSTPTFSSPLRNKLLDLFGFTSFRSGQEWAIHRCLSFKRTLLVAPTGMGKSLCYALPAAMMDGLCIVVSPLVSLMEVSVCGFLISHFLYLNFLSKEFWLV